MKKYLQESKYFLYLCEKYYILKLLTINRIINFC